MAADKPSESVTAIKVAIVDDQALIRTGFQMIIDAEDDMQVVASIEDGSQALEAVLRYQPDVVLMDIRMPRLDGIQATQTIHEHFQTTQANSAGLKLVAPAVLILTTFDLDEYVFDALRAGASGFLLKDTPPETLIAGIRVVANGDSLLSPKITTRLIEQFATAPQLKTDIAGFSDLTEREREVFMCISKGMSNAEIAESLFVGETTVKTHVSRVLAKLSLRDRVQAVVLAYESGMVKPGENSP